MSDSEPDNAQVWVCVSCDLCNHTPVTILSYVCLVLMGVQMGVKPSEGGECLSNEGSGSGGGRVAFFCLVEFCKPSENSVLQDWRDVLGGTRFWVFGVVVEFQFSPIDSEGGVCNEILMKFGGGRFRGGKF